MKDLETILTNADHVLDVHHGICDAFPGPLAAFRERPPMPTAPVATTAACLRDAIARDPALQRDRDRPIRVLIAGAQVPEALEHGRLWQILGRLAGVDQPIDVFLVGPEVDSATRLSAHRPDAIPDGLFRGDARCDVHTFKGSCGAFLDSGVEPAFDLCCAYTPGFAYFGGSWALSGDLGRILEASRHVYASASPGIDTVADRALLHVLGCQISGAPIPDFSYEVSPWPDPEAQWLCHEVYRVDRWGPVKTLSASQRNTLIGGMAVTLALSAAADEAQVPQYFEPTRPVEADVNYYSLSCWFAAAWEGDELRFVFSLGDDVFDHFEGARPVARNALMAGAGCWNVMDLLSGHVENVPGGPEFFAHLWSMWADGMDRAA